MINTLKSLVSGNQRHLARGRKVVAKINSLEPVVEKMDYAQMQERVAEMRMHLKPLVDALLPEQKLSLTKVERHKGLPAAEQAIVKKLMEFLPEMFAFIREAYKREMGIRHYDVQLLGGYLIAEGQRLAEIKTGEGKTMIFNLPLFLYSLVGRGTHLVTANEYLAKRDAEYAGQIASKLGLSVGVVAPGGTSFRFIDSAEVLTSKGQDVYDELTALGKAKLSSMKGLQLLETDKRTAYGCDMTFSVNNELGFDYLRDNMAQSLDRIVQRELYFCIIDEADSILIDEARTPLIISAQPTETSTEKYMRFAQAVKLLAEDEGDYTVDYKARSVLITDQGIEKVEKFLDVDNMWADFSMVHQLENALKAKALYLNDQEYLVRNGDVLIVDTFTGRVLEGRRFSEGLHQAIEAKEGVKIQQENLTFATITFQNFFRLYKILCGGSGTILTESEEFFKIYSLDSVGVPTNKPTVRQDVPDRIYSNQELKFKAVAKDVKERYDLGQPVLVGTTSVEKSELLSKFLDQLGVTHEVLNAKYHDREAQIVAKAGKKGGVTVATNMAGRGTDIPIDDQVRELGGLAVIGTERHESRRIDNQLRGRSGRQGDPGFSRFYVALDDTIMKMMGGDLLQRTVGRIMDPDAPIEMGMISKQIETAQKRVEWANFDSRKNVVEYDDVMSRQREVFYARRRKLLELTDSPAPDQANQAGETGVDSIVDPETARQNARELRLQQLQDLAWEMWRNFAYNIVHQQFLAERKLNEDNAHNLAAALLDLAPDAMVAAAFDIPRENAMGGIKDEMRGKDEQTVSNFVSEGLRKLFDAKTAEYSQDFPIILKLLVLEAMDKLWMEHLETMNDVRTGIGLQGYAQRNPLVEYKNAAFQQFAKLMEEIDAYVVRRYCKMVKVDPKQIANQAAVTQKLNLQSNAEEISDINTGDREMMPNVGAAQVQKAMRDMQARAGKLEAAISQATDGNKTVRNINNSPNGEKLGRNDPCWCGSGKKFKNCHGKAA
jgi:preprotein translocase subunit SecA